jgi:putative MFS transporter
MPQQARWSQLLGPALRRRSAVACTIFVCQVIPYFALGTFVARVLAALHVGSATAAGVTYNMALLGGAMLGLWGGRAGAEALISGGRLCHRCGCDGDLRAQH